MPNRFVMLVSGVLLMLGTAGAAAAQDGAQQTSARDDLQRVHAPRSIDEELARLTKDMELTPKQQQEVRPLLEEHHDKVQALLDKNPNASRQELGPQIHALLTDHQKELEKLLVHREHNGEEKRRSSQPALSASDAATPTGPSSSAS